MSDLIAADRRRHAAMWEALATDERWLRCPLCGYRLPWLCTPRADDVVSENMRVLHECAASPEAVAKVAAAREALKDARAALRVSLEQHNVPLPWERA